MTPPVFFPVTVTLWSINNGVSASSFSAVGIWVVYVRPSFSLPVTSPLGSIVAVETLLSVTWLTKPCR